MYDYLIVGSGLAGSVLAERLASQLNKKVLVIDKRNHIAGNVFDYMDDNGILVHKYGPHAFHTNSLKVSRYLTNFTEWRFYEHRVLVNHAGIEYPFPVNINTLNLLYDLDLKNESDMQNYLDSVRIKKNVILNSEDLVLNNVGPDIYQKFYKYYTLKQWKLPPEKLLPSVCGRIPVRFNSDDRYFTDKFQYIPANGYTKMVQNILNHKNIDVAVNTDYLNVIESVKFNKIIYTGPLDSYFNYIHGKLPYRSLIFKFEYHDIEYYQKVAQVNYCSIPPDFTRVVEFKHLTGQKAPGTTIAKEFPVSDGEPFYPIPNEENNRVFNLYKKEAQKIKHLYFCGRLADYKYYNMDQVIARALKLFEKIVGNI